MTAALFALRALRCVVGLAGAVATDLHDMARRAVLIRIDHLLHGAPCPCCKHQETDQ